MPSSDEALNAHEFVSRRLREVTGSRSPAELADEYGCSNTHMRDVCRDLLENGDVAQPRWGQYTAPSGGEGEPVESGDGGEAPAEEDAGGESPSDVEVEATESSDSDVNTSVGKETGDGPGDAEIAAAGAATAASAGPALLDREFATSTLAVMGVAVVVTVAFLLVWDGPDEEEPDDDPDRGEGVADPSADFTEAFEA